jgi:hypothetical protein
MIDSRWGDDRSRWWSSYCAATPCCLEKEFQSFLNTTTSRRQKSLYQVEAVIGVQTCTTDVILTIDYQTLPPSRAPAQQTLLPSRIHPGLLLPAFAKSRAAQSFTSKHVPSCYWTKEIDKGDRWPSIHVSQQNVSSLGWFCSIPTTSDFLAR